MSKYNNVVEVHGCIVCAKVFNILAVYAPDGRLVDCTVTSPGGHIVPDKQRPLVACDTHTAEEVESAYKRWKSKRSEGANNEQEED
jgi:hypothetical protein